MKDSATSVIATVPMAKVSGAAGPAACTTRVILKAAVTVGEMTASERPMHSGRFNRDIRLAMNLRASTYLRGLPRSISPHHKGSYLRVRHHAASYIRQSLVDDGDALLGLGNIQGQWRGECQTLPHAPTQQE